MIYCELSNFINWRKEQGKSIGFLCFKQRNPGVVLLEEVHEVGSWCCVAQVDIGGSHNNSNDLRSPPCFWLSRHLSIFWPQLPHQKRSDARICWFFAKDKKIPFVPELPDLTGCALSELEPVNFGFPSSCPDKWKTLTPPLFSNIELAGLCAGYCLFHSIADCVLRT